MLAIYQICSIYVGIVQDCLEASEIQLLSECSQRRYKKKAPSSGKVVLCNACASAVSELGTGVQRGHFFNESAFLNDLPKASGWCLVQASPLRKSPALGETAAMPRASLAEDFYPDKLCVKSPSGRLGLQSPLDQVQMSSESVGDELEPRTVWLALCCSSACSCVFSVLGFHGMPLWAFLDVLLVSHR